MEIGQESKSNVFNDWRTSYRIYIEENQDRLLSLGFKYGFVVGSSAYFFFSSILDYRVLWIFVSLQCILAIIAVGVWRAILPKSADSQPGILLRIARFVLLKLHSSAFVLTGFVISFGFVILVSSFME